MNLWVKPVRQLLAVLIIALFFFGCEDEASLVGYKNPNSRFNVKYIEVPLTSKVLLMDSIYTSDSHIVLGEYTDPALGQITAVPYLKFAPTSRAPLSYASGVTSVFDSVTVRLRPSYYTYNLAGAQDQVFTVNPLIQPIYNRGTYLSYYSIQHALPLGEITFKVSPQIIKNELALAADKRSLVASARIDNDNTWAQGLWNIAHDQKMLIAFDTIARGEYEVNPTRQFMGFALVPQSGNAIVGFNYNDPFTGLYLHYHTVKDGAIDQDSLSFNFYFHSPSFTRLSADHSGTDLAGLPGRNISFDPGTGKRVVQSGTGLVTVLDLENFYAAVENIPSMGINFAELVVGGVESSESLPAHQRLTLRVLRSQDGPYANFRIQEDLANLSPFIRDRVLNERSFPYLDPAPSRFTTFQVFTLEYNDSEKKYTGLLDTFLQSVYRHRDEANRVRYLAIKPFTAIPQIETDVTRTVFDGNTVKLRIYYTEPLTQENE